MKEIICPNCHKTFTIDEAAYAQIESQIRNEILENELKKQEEAIQKQYDATLLLEKEKSKRELEKTIGEQKNAIQRLESEIDALKKDKENAVALEASRNSEEITRLKSQIENAEQKAKLQIQDAIGKEKDKQIALEMENQKLESELKVQAKEKDLEIKRLHEDYANQIKMKDNEVEFYREMKAKLSTKAIGESLEVYCHNEFDKIRSITYPRAYFEKDNDVVDGTKGDFVFKNFDENGTEYLSIMFEMKNEADDTKTKHKNDEFFKKLDEDRKKKGCEYAVLVSLLEQESDLYNQGIVDVSYKYPNMYVIRPQFFLPLIALLDGAMRKSANALALVNEEKKRSVDVENFEAKLNEFQTAFGKNYESSVAHFEKAISEIDNTISRLNKVREELTTSSNQLRYANDKAQKLSIKRLTKDSPTLAAKFEAIEAETEEK